MLFMLFHVIFLVFFCRIFPREYLLQHVHLYSLADLQQVSFFPVLTIPFFSLFIHIHACRLTQNHFHCCFVIYEIIYEVSPNGVKYCKMCSQLSGVHTTERTNLQMCRFLKDLELSTHNNCSKKYLATVKIEYRCTRKDRSKWK